MIEANAYALVKGTPEDAAKAARAQQVPVLEMVVFHPGEVKVIVPHWAYPRLQEWYLADCQRHSQAPFPAGSLLHFGAEAEA